MTNVTDYISITTGDLGSGVKYENFELIKRIPVGSEIYCRLVVTDEEGATGSGESL